MIDVVVKFNQSDNNFLVYESSTKTVIVSQTLGEGFGNLNKYLLESGLITKSLLEDSEIQYHMDSHTFQEIIKSNMSLLKRVSDIPSEFKNSASKFGGMPKDAKPKDSSRDFSRGSKKFQRGKFSGDSDFGKSYKKFKR